MRIIPWNQKALLRLTHSIPDILNIILYLLEVLRVSHPAVINILPQREQLLISYAPGLAARQTQILLHPPHLTHHLTLELKYSSSNKQVRRALCPLGIGPSIASGTLEGN